MSTPGTPGDGDSPEGCKPLGGCASHHAAMQSNETETLCLRLLRAFSYVRQSSCFCRGFLTVSALGVMTRGVAGAAESRDRLGTATFQPIACRGRTQDQPGRRGQRPKWGVTRRASYFDIDEQRGLLQVGGFGGLSWECALTSARWRSAMGLTSRLPVAFPACGGAVQ